jgi:hypothetical protein
MASQHCLFKTNAILCQKLGENRQKENILKLIAKVGLFLLQRYVFLHKKVDKISF